MVPPEKLSPFFPKQLGFDPTVWKTWLRVLMQLHLTNMLKLLHLLVEFLHFADCE
jgi:hypothetical protein